MADIKLTQVKSGGGSLDIGDIIQTERTALPDGKTLLPMDNTLLDEVTYPQLALVYNPKLQTLRSLVGYTSDRGNYHNGKASPLGDKFYHHGITGGGNMEEISTNPELNIATTLVNAVASIYLCDIAVSADGQKIAVLGIGSGAQLYCYYSSDEGATFSGATVITGATGGDGALPTSNNNDKHNRICFTSSGDIRVSYIASGSEWEFFESTDGNTTWSQIWTTGAPFDATAMSSGSSGYWSNDGSTFACINRLNSFGNIIIRNGVYTKPTNTPTYHTAAAFNCSVAADGSRITMMYGYPSKSSNGVNFPYWYTDDDGATPWNSRVADCTELVKFLTFESQQRFTIYASNLVISKVDKDYGYFVFGGVVPTHHMMPILVRVHLPTGKTERIPCANSNPSSTFTTYNVVVLETTLSVDGDIEYVYWDYSGRHRSVTEVGYGKYLVNPTNTPNLKIVADAP